MLKNSYYVKQEVYYKCHDNVGIVKSITENSDFENKLIYYVDFGHLNRNIPCLEEHLQSKEDYIRELNIIKPGDYFYVLGVLPNYKIRKHKCTLVDDTHISTDSGCYTKERCCKTLDLLLEKIKKVFESEDVLKWT